MVLCISFRIYINDMRTVQTAQNGSSARRCFVHAKVQDTVNPKEKGEVGKALHGTLHRECEQKQQVTRSVQWRAMCVQWVFARRDVGCVQTPPIYFIYTGG
jgi:hypothetical protein